MREFVTCGNTSWSKVAPEPSFRMSQTCLLFLGGECYKSSRVSQFSRLDYSSLLDFQPQSFVSIAYNTMNSTRTAQPWCSDPKQRTKVSPSDPDQITTPSSTFTGLGNDVNRSDDPHIQGDSNLSRPSLEYPKHPHRRRSVSLPRSASPKPKPLSKRAWPLPEDDTPSKSQRAPSQWRKNLTSRFMQKFRSHGGSSHASVSHSHPDQDDSPNNQAPASKTADSHTSHGKHGSVPGSTRRT